MIEIPIPVLVGLVALGVHFGWRSAKLYAAYITVREGLKLPNENAAGLRQSVVTYKEIERMRFWDYLRSKP